MIICYCCLRQMNAILFSAIISTPICLYEQNCMIISNRGAGAPRTSTRGQFKALCVYPFLWVGFVGILILFSPRK